MYKLRIRILCLLPVSDSVTKRNETFFVFFAKKVCISPQTMV